jgi:hypothetical protein
MGAIAGMDAGVGVDVHVAIANMCRRKAWNTRDSITPRDALRFAGAAPIEDFNICHQWCIS